MAQLWVKTAFLVSFFRDLNSRNKALLVFLCGSFACFSLCFFLFLACTWHEHVIVLAK